MLHRIFAMLIVGFWLAMTGLLVMREIFPELSRLNRVPVSYVGGLLFQHGQSSDLQIYDAGKEVGYFHLQPRLNADKKTRVAEYHGMLLLNPLGMAKQRVSWSGALTMSERNDLKKLQISLSTQDPGHQLDVFIDFETDTAKYLARANGQLIDQSTITLDRDGVAKLVGRAGIDPTTIQQLLEAPNTAPEPELHAYQSSTRLNGETVSTYLVSMKVSGQTLFEAHVSQLGQVLRAQAPLFGYKLAPPNVTP